MNTRNLSPPNIFHRAAAAFLAISLAALSGASCRCSKDAGAPPTDAAELWLGGDVHVGQGPGNGLSSLSKAFQNGWGIVNLEGPVGSGPVPEKEPPEDNGIYEPPGEPADPSLQLQNNPEALVPLRQSGVRVMGIANNHAGDRGIHGPENTANALLSAGILPAGEPIGPAAFELGGQKIVVAAFDLSPGAINNLPEALQQAKKKGDFLIATFHVTGPPSYLPRPELRAAVDIALEAGARVIAAHGTHALGPVERRGNAVIAWGLGNLLFNCPCTDEVDGAILHIRLEGQSILARIVPVDAGLQGHAAEPARHAGLILELFDALGSSPLRREIFRGIETGVF